MLILSQSIRQQQRIPGIRLSALITTDIRGRDIQGKPVVE
jgi:hypothetical protein